MNVMERRRGALVIIAPLVIALAVAWIIYDPFHMLGRDVAFARSPVWLWVIGVGILGSIIAYGILRTRQRTAAETNLTQAATRDLYRREEKDRREQELP
jgi:uncharacterized membrane protein